MVGINTYYYQATLMAQEFLEPIRYDLVMGIDDHDLYSTDEQLDRGKPAGPWRHGNPPGGGDEAALLSI
jgi:hypothetical protein